MGSPVKACEARVGPHQSKYVRPGLGNGIFSLTWWVPTHVLNCEFLLYLLTALSSLPCYPFQQLGSCVCDLEQACQLANWAIHYVNCRAPWKFAFSITCQSCEIRHLPAWAFRTPLSFLSLKWFPLLPSPFIALPFQPWGPLLEPFLWWPLTCLNCEREWQF